MRRPHDDEEAAAILASVPDGWFWDFQCIADEQEMPQIHDLLYSWVKRLIFEIILRKVDMPTELKVKSRLTQPIHKI